VPDPAAPSAQAPQKIGPQRARRAALAALFEFENTLPPRAFLAQIAHAATRDNRLLADTLQNSVTAQFLMAQPQLQPFIARILSPDAILLEGATEKAHRGLLVAFTGRKSRLMMPLPMFLQGVDAMAWDVLLLRDRKLSHYRHGCAGFGTTFMQLVSHVADTAAPYRTTAAIGTSMGGLAAVRLALCLGNIRAVSVGGRPPDDAGRLLAGEDAGPGFDPICACLPRVPRDLLFVYSGCNGRDRTAAGQAATLTGGIDLPIGAHADHSLLWWLQQQGRFAAFLQTLLDPKLPTRRMPGALRRQGIGPTPIKRRFRLGWLRLVAWRRKIPLRKIFRLA
jgi:hypothetical protein